MKAEDFPDRVKAILLERGKEYSTQEDGHEERNMSHIVGAFNAITGHNLSVHDGWMFMVCLKARRCSTRGSIDDHVDLSGYAALAGEEKNK